MNSKVLANEKKTTIGVSMELYYGSYEDILSITVKGKFRPIEKQKDYQKNSKDSKSLLILHTNKYLESLATQNIIAKHFIFSTDFTEKGISMTKSYKFKYQLYIKPISEKTSCGIEQLITDIVAHINELLSSILEKNNSRKGRRKHCSEA